MSFTDLATVKSCLGIPPANTKEDAKIQLIVDAVNGELLTCLCLDQCDPKQYTVVADIPSWQDRRVTCVAVCPIPIVTVDEVKNADKVLTKGTDYVVEPPDLICLCCDWWHPGCEKAEITITAGFNPGDLKLAALKLGAADLAVSMFQGGPGVMKSETIGRYRYERREATSTGLQGAAGWPDSLARAMAPFWRPERGVMAVVRP